MSELDEIFRKRLERIREELNDYIKLQTSTKVQTVSSFAEECVSQKKKEGNVKIPKPVQAPPEFLNRMSFGGGQSSEPETSQGSLKISDLLPYVNTKPGTPGSSFSYSVPHPEYLKKPGERSELDKVLEKKEESFSAKLLRLIDEKGLKDADVYRRANIDRRLFSKIRSDAEYVPSKKTAISFCLALGLELEEAKKLLATAGYALSESARFDRIITFMINNKEYNINFVNIVLDDYGEGTLSR